MKRVYASRVIEAPIDDVWGPLRNIEEVAEWYPDIEDMKIENGLAPDQVGAIRNFKFEGHLYREQLVALDDVEYLMAYTVLDFRYPVENYLAHQRLREVTHSSEPSTFIEWWNEWDTHPDNLEEIRGIFQEQFDVGLKKLDEYVTTNA